jgi:hypothetical protein
MRRSSPAGRSQRSNLPWPALPAHATTTGAGECSQTIAIDRYDDSLPGEGTRSSVKHPVMDGASDKTEQAAEECPHKQKIT